MMRLSLSLSIAVLFLATVGQATAGTYAVGSCKPQLPSYSTISAAVSSVAAGSHILVCPGTYPEQVSITQPLTLDGISSGNSGRAIITVPGEAEGNPQLQVNASSCLLECGGVAAQLLVQNVNPPGPVVVSNITVDGTGAEGGDCFLGGGFGVFGIFYSAGSSGTILRTTTRHQQGGGCGVGIAVENELAPAQSVTVRDNSVHDADNGIVTGIEGPEHTLTTTVAGNFVANSTNRINSNSSAILVFNAATTVHDNFVTGSMNGITGAILNDQNSILVSSNKLADNGVGMILLGAGVIGKSNAISHSSVGVAFTEAVDENNGATAQSNTIMNADIAIRSFCFITSGLTLTGNDINDANIGVDKLASSNSLSRTRFNNVDTITTSCN